MANAATLAQADVVVAAMRDDGSARLHPVAVRGTLASLYDRDQSPRPCIDWPAAPGRQASGTLTHATDLGLRPTNPLAPAQLHAYRVGTADETYGVFAIGSADGDAIHAVARIVSVGDALDAMTSDRPYRSRIGFDDALAEIQDERGRQFDPRAVDALCATADAGTLRLTSIHDNLGLMLRRSGRDPGV